MPNVDEVSAGKVDDDEEEEKAKTKTTKTHTRKKTTTNRQPNKRLKKY